MWDIDSEVDSSGCSCAVDNLCMECLIFHGKNPNVGNV